MWRLKGARHGHDGCWRIDVPHRSAWVWRVGASWSMRAYGRTTRGHVGLRGYGQAGGRAASPEADAGRRVDMCGQMGMGLWACRQGRADM